MHGKHLISVILYILLTNSAIFGQSYWKIDKSSVNCYPTAAQLRTAVEFLSDSLTEGRSRESAGHSTAAFYLIDKFRRMKLKPVDSSYCQSFRVAETGSPGHNILGIWHGGGMEHSGKYVVVGAHYDGIGIINGTLYPGADSNASGVAALLATAKFFRSQRLLGYLYESDIIFVAFDSYIDGREGSKAFWQSIADGMLTDPVSGKTIRPDDISLMIDIDQVGSTLSPVEPDKPEYLIAIGEKSLKKDLRGNLERCNWFYYCDLALYDTYYGSENFTKVFYRIGDRRHFINAGVPTVYFTSGITNLNNSPEDTAATLNYDVLKKRTILIFRFIEKCL